MKMLIAEDSLIHQIILQEYLSGSNYEVMIANDGKEAWELWKEFAPEIVVTDINMPYMNGHELIRNIREHEIGTYTHIITITGSQEIHELEKSFVAGSDDFMVKPIQENEFIFRLRVGERVSRSADKKAFFDTLARLTELRDRDTGGHVNRIKTFTKILALHMKKMPKYAEIMTETYVKNLILSSVLHDVGKIGIDDDLLKSKSIYTAEERVRMQKHTIFGSQLLSEIKEVHPNMGFLDLAISIARSHHERFDGNGYPDKLKGVHIPLEARIVSIADVFDALISKRAYKQAFPLQKTLDIMYSESGRQFDPELIDVLKSVIDEIITTLYSTIEGEL